MKVLTAPLLLLFLTCPALARWSTVNFEVIGGNPHLTRKGTSSYDSVSSGLSQTELIAIEGCRRFNADLTFPA